ncbi:MAG: Undecaprenyl-phosphate galactose phosphotransferase, partial [Frankiales bacterium]|nr:Undecaprenyl-phosphate galactose phosphotransferase [Frankiales bacterium]
AEGPDEYKRVGSASLRLFGLLGFLAFATKTDVARGFVLLFLPLGLAGLFLGRWLMRVRLARTREHGRSYHRVLVVGNYSTVHELVTQLENDLRHGFRVVGACVSGTPHGDAEAVHVVGGLGDVRQVVKELGVDTVAVAGSPELTGESLRRLSYDLEGTGIDLLVAPALLNVAGNRISIRPVAGVPLLHVDEPELDGARKVVKMIFDRSTSLLLLVLLSPVLLAAMIAVKVTSRGPMLFRQTRVGRDGQLFSLLKLRTMQVDAEQRLQELLDRNEVRGGVLFKLKDDPRVTPLGRFLRKWSLDELPQLINVLAGQMSMVGPRPPLPTEVEKYEGHAHRRLLVKPGITGLWQVSGRSDLSWEDAVRLDLQYVENWSLGLDMAVLAKTLLAVVRSAGAY